MTCKILNEPTLAECWEVSQSSNTFLFGGEEKSQVAEFDRLCLSLEKGEWVSVLLFGDTWYRGVVEQVALARGYEIVYEGIATELVAA